MIRYSQINKLLARSRYIIDHRKPRVEIPSNKVPKYVYEVKYHPQANPGIDLGFPDHRHTNPFQDVAGAKHENFRYRYSGQWWQGYTVSKLFMFFAPVTLFITLAYIQQENIKANNQTRVNAANPQVGIIKNLYPRDMR